MSSDGPDVTAASRTFLAPGSKANAWEIRRIQATNDHSDLTFIVDVALLGNGDINLVVNEISNPVLCPGDET